MVKYSSLDEALSAGAEFTNVSDNGEYVERLVYEDGVYSITRWVFKQCVMTKTFKNIKSVLKYWKIPADISKIRRYHSLDEIEKSLKEAVYAEKEDVIGLGYNLWFLREKDDYSNYELGVSKYFAVPNKYYLEAKIAKRFGFGETLFVRVAEENKMYSEYCSELIEVLKKSKLEDGWYVNLEVEIEGGEK